MAVTTGDLTAPDTFTFTHRGAEQFDGEWLADSIVYLFYRAGGFFGVNVFKAAILLLTFFFLMKAMLWSRPRDTTEDGEDRWGPANWLLASAVTAAVVLFSIRFRLYVRPFLFSFLFVSVFLYVLERHRRTGESRLLYLLPLVELVWANTSKGAFFGPVIFLAYGAGELFAGRFDRRLVLTFMGIFVLSLASPETFSIYTMPFRITALDKDFFVGEHQPLTAELLWGYGIRYTAMYQLLVLGSVVYLVLFRGFRNVYHLLLFGLFFLASVKMVRMVDFFSLVSGVLFVGPVARLFRPLSSGGTPGSGRAGAAAYIISFVFLALALIGATTGRTYAFGSGVKERTFPEGALTYLDRMGITGPVFNSYPLGGYIIWRSPDRPVFIDGRGVHYLYTADFFNRYARMIKDHDAFKEGEREWGFEVAVLEYDLKGGGLHFPRHLAPDPNWALVYWDGHSAVFLKRTPANRAAIEAGEYTVAKPTFYDFAYLGHYLQAGTAPRAAELLKAEIALNPDNQEPRLARAFLLYNMRAPWLREEALKEVNAALALAPDLPMEHVAAAILLLDKGEREEALREVERALTLNPADPSALELKGRIEGGRKPAAP